MSSKQIPQNASAENFFRYDDSVPHANSVERADQNSQSEETTETILLCVFKKSLHNRSH